MKRAFGKSVAAVLAVFSMFCLFACAPAAAAENIKEGVPYYIQEIRTGAFHYYGTQTAVTRPADKNLGRNDPTYCEFSDNFKRFKIGFYEWTSERDAMDNIVREGWLTPPAMTEFIAANVKRENGQMTADISGVVGGRVVHYSLTTDAAQITLRADVTYELRSDIPIGDGIYEHTVTRNTKVIVFRRMPPSYITAGGDS